MVFYYIKRVVWKKPPHIGGGRFSTDVFRTINRFFHKQIIVTEQKKLAEEKQTKVDVIQEEDSNGVIEVPVPEQFSPEM